MSSNTLNDLKRFAQGKITYDDFELLTYTDSDLWTTLQSMLTEDMKKDQNHLVWSDRGVRMILEANNFSVRSSVEAFGIDTEFGRMRLHHIVGQLVSFHYPDIIIKAPKTESDSDLLCKLKLEYISGSEVDGLIEEIIDSVPNDLTKKERNSKIKEYLKDVFHIKKKHPDWAQESEWPMGQASPMEYMSSESIGDLVKYTFRDVDTGEIRIIEQLF